MREKVRDRVDTVLNGIEYEITVYSQAEPLLENLKEGKRYDLYILDVELPDLSGLTLAKKIAKLQPEAVVIFLTENLSYAEDGYIVNAFRFILKEHFETRFAGALRDGVKESARRASHVLVIQHYQEFHRIPHRDILYVSKHLKYTLITDRSGREYKLRRSLRELQQDLGSEHFVLIERGYLVNLAMIQSIENGEVQLPHGIRLPVSKKHVGELLDRVNAYWSRKGRPNSLELPPPRNYIGKDIN